MRRRVIVLAIIAVLLGATGFAAWFLWKNTAFIRPSPSPEQVRENNKGPSAPNLNGGMNANSAPPTLVAQTLEVPDQFRRGTFATPRTLLAPSNVTVSVFAAGLDAPRFFTLTPEGALVVADKGAGKIVLLPDSDRDGVADRVIEVDRGLRDVHSVALDGSDLYAAEENRTVVYRGFREDGTFERKDVLVSGLPTGGHVTRTVLVGPDRKLYLSVGSSCNLCEEKDERRAAVVRYDLDGRNGTVFARGLRNSVGIVFRGNELWGVDNGRDLLGDDRPPEELNRLEEGKHYGWPYCYGDRIANPEYQDRADFCRTQTSAPVVEMQAHSAPLGLTVIPDNSAVGGGAGQFLTAFHGSWNRTVPTGYKVVRLDPDSLVRGADTVLSGWLDERGEVWGRPVGVGFAPNGTLFVSDDKAGAIYRVTRR